MPRIKELDKEISIRYGLQPGDEVLSIDGKKIKDYLDFLYYTAEDQFVLRVRKEKTGREETVLFENTKNNLGISLEGIVFDGLRTCQNKCIFCFVDQGGPVKRSSLKIKDDDYRFSFLQGSFITLTNLKKEELERIKNWRLTPLYISVHSTDSGVRSRMMGNPEAGRVLPLLEDLTTSGIFLHTQIVVCPGYNDGRELEKTIEDLYSLGPEILSIGVVPVGLTKYRKGLPSLEPVKEDKAREILQTINKWQARFYQTRRSRVIFGADELYALTGWELPSHEEYEEYPQLENGIGLARLLREESKETIKSLKTQEEKFVAGFFTSKLGAWAWEPVLDKLKEKGVFLRTLAPANSFLGPHISVTGLLAGRDLHPFLEKKDPLPALVFLPRVMFNEDGKTLDDYSLFDLQEQFSPVRIKLASDLGEILEKINSFRGESL